MRTRMLWFLVPIIFWPIGTFAESDLTRAVEDLVAKVDAKYSRIKDLQADFTQETRIEGFDTPLTSSGEVLIKKPGLLRWNYVEPSVEQILVKGDQVEMFVPDHNQVIRGSLTRMAATKAPLQLLQGAGKLGEHFSIMATGKGERGHGGLPLLTLIPKPQENGGVSPITKIVSEIQPKTHFIERVSLYENSGNVSTFRFNNLSANNGLDANKFELSLPKDVVIVDDLFPQ